MLKQILSIIIPGIVLILTFAYEAACADNWNEIDEGLYLSTFHAPIKAVSGDSVITVVKIDPTLYDFRLLSVSELHGKPNTVKEWVKENRLILAVNAGMFKEDLSTNVGYMKNFKHINNRKINKAYKAMIAFNRRQINIPTIQILDLECDKRSQMMSAYATLIQNIRMIGCNGENVWRKTQGYWSIVALAIDTKGKVLIIFAESAYSVKEFIEAVLKLPLSVKRMTYLEGGRMAALYMSHRSVEVELVGAYNSASDYDNNTISWPVPNVIGITKKSRPHK